MDTLTLAHVTGGYGDITVLRDMTLSLDSGQALALVGRNGAGKTTTLKMIAGLLSPAAGTITYEGADVTTTQPYHRVSQGLAMVQEGKRIFRSLTVEENLRLGAYSVNRLSNAQFAARKDAVLDRLPMLRSRLGQIAGAMSGGQQQMLAIGQALIREPRTLLIDEPSAGLAPSIVGDVYETLKDLRDEGLSLIVAEQSLGWALSIADRLAVIDLGRVLYDGDPGTPEAETAVQALHITRESTHAD